MNTDPQDLLALANEAIATAQFAEGSPAFKNLAPLLYRLGRAVQCFRADTLRAVPAPVAPLAVLGAEIVAINKANGWNVTTPDAWTDANAGTGIDENRQKHYRLAAILMLIVSEAAEALEAVRHADRANFEEELADVLIRVLDLSHGLGIDMDAVVAAKLAKNRTRGFRHGGKSI